MHRKLDPPACRRAVAFCGIARPNEFFQSLAAAGIAITARAAFRDHHAWTQADLDHLLTLQRNSKADAFVTTEKDAIRLTSAQRAHLEASAPLQTAPLRVHFEDESAIRAHLRTVLQNTKTIPSL